MIKEGVIRILLADDDSDDCLLFGEALNELEISFLLDVVHDGDQLIDFLGNARNEKPDFIFLDLNMPRKSGFECLCEIRQQISSREIPVIIFSTSIDEELAIKLHELGASLYVRKPGTFENL